MDSDAQWYAVWTRSRHEQVVRDQLERKEIAAFLPTIPRWSRWKDRKKKIDWPLFPGYCFARFDPEDALPILKCTGVVNIVSVEGKPAPIPEYELDSIRLLVGSDLQFDPCPMIRRRDDGRSDPRSASRRHRAAAAKGRTEGAAGAVGRSDRAGGVASKSTPPTSSPTEIGRAIVRTM